MQKLKGQDSISTEPKLRIANLYSRLVQNNETPFSLSRKSKKVGKEALDQYKSQDNCIQKGSQKMGKWLVRAFRQARFRLFYIISSLNGRKLQCLLSRKSIKVILSVIQVHRLGRDWQRKRRQTAKTRNRTDTKKRIPWGKKWTIGGSTGMDGS